MEMVSQSCTASETWMMSLLEELEYFLNAPPEVSEGGKPGNQLACRVLRYFRKDGHNWRKKKDGKTVKETHERLKGSLTRCFCPLSRSKESSVLATKPKWNFKGHILTASKRLKELFNVPKKLKELYAILRWNDLCLPVFILLMVKFLHKQRIQRA
ncbi:uncharacterized protein LOC111291817 isoform X3 [Durio zibethinus]|uniref:Uncharacterized protein LOC111291817 isoform X3 n=1 Tax=Durio zibethinus TaxID=66656 RepID=A0A6P5YGQ3_DURZI|nr:uncharacterized protein LOC111291817 isoform X3 [Durio zibethinus]